MTSTFAPNTPVDADPNDDLTFVRCPTLTHSSMNGQTNGPSSILCDVPCYIHAAAINCSSRTKFLVLYSCTYSSRLLLS